MFWYIICLGLIFLSVIDFIFQFCFHFLALKTWKTMLISNYIIAILGVKQFESALIINRILVKTTNNAWSFQN